MPASPDSSSQAMLHNSITRQLHKASLRHNLHCQYCLFHKHCQTGKNSIARTRLYRKGEIIYRSGDPQGFLYQIHHGAVKTYGVTCDGHEQILDFYFADDGFGIDSLASHSHTVYARALQDSEICQLPLQQIFADREACRQLLQLSAAQMHKSQQHLALINRNPAATRLAALLLEIASRLPDDQPSAHSFTLPLSRSDMASYLGLTIETISRTSARLEQAGLVVISGKQISIIDLPGLQQLSYF